MNNPLFLDRTHGIGKLDAAAALQHGVTGPMPACLRRELGPAQGAPVHGL